jgi:hypothetical protein
VTDDDPTMNDLIRAAGGIKPPDPTKEPTEEADPGKVPSQGEEPPAEEPTFNELLHRRGR